MHKDIQEAVKILKQGGLVVYPTDTAYGFAVDATNLAAIKKLYALKGRSFKKPIQVIFPSIEKAQKVLRISPYAKKLMKTFWPGAVSFVLPLRSKAKNWVMLSGRTGTIGIRNPASVITQQLVKKFGKPITTTSANLSGQPTAYTLNEVKTQYHGKKAVPDYYLDGGRLKKNSISTLLQIDGQNVTLIREGVVKFSRIQKAIKKL